MERTLTEIKIPFLAIKLFEKQTARPWKIMLLI